MIAIKRNISFIVEVKKTSAKDDKKAKQPEGRLRCVVTWNGQRVRLTVNHNVNVDGWEKSLQRCRAKSVHGKMKTPASVINKDLDKTEEIINSIFLRFEDAETVPTKEEFIREYDKIVNPDKGGKKEDEVAVADRPLFSIYDEFVSEGTLSGRWSAGTLVKARTIRQHLFAISKNLSLNNVISGGINLFIRHFAGVPDNVKEKGLANTTIQNDIAFVKTFLRWAQEHGYCDANSFLNQRVRLKTAERQVLYLTWEELMRVYHHDFGKKNYLAQVRDVFCFCCFTSLRYSDVYNLRRSNISNGVIHITTVKTHDSLTIELNKYSQAILDKYADVTFPMGKALPVISNQRMNNYLKEMGMACELNELITITRYKGTRRFDKTYKKWELLTTHCGRRTFVCNAIMLGVPADIVMKWTGHSDYDSMRPYLAIADKAKAMAMTVFDRVDENGFVAPDSSGQKAGQKDDDE